MRLIRFASVSRPPRRESTPSSSNCSSRLRCWPWPPSRRFRLLERDHHIHAKRDLIVIAVKCMIRRMIPADFGPEFQIRAPLIVGERFDRQADGGLVNVLHRAETIVVAIVNPLDAALE